MPVLTRKKRITLVLIALAAFAWVAHSAHRSLLVQQRAQNATASGPLLAGMTMPQDLSLESLDGKPTALADLRGKVLLVNFWAGWCTPCLHEMPSLFAMQKRLAPRGLVVLGVNMDDNPAGGMAALRKAAGESAFVMYKGTNAPIADRFALEGLPFTVLVDKNFKIVYARAGELDWDSPRAKDLVEALL